MKIWLEKAPTYYPATGNCECPIYSAQQAEIDLLLIAEDIQYIQTGLFKQSTPLYIQQCENERWLVCHPIGSGNIAVLDSLAYFLFEQFQTPTTLSQVMQVVPDWPVETVERAIASFLKLGFLQDLHSGSPVYEWREDESLTVWMHVTNACNLRCPYCYLQKTSENMADDTAQRSVDAVFRSASRHNIKRVKLKYAGGEASLYMRHVTAIHDYAAQVAREHAISFDAVLLSNGVAVSQHTIDKLKARDITVMISLDGISSGNQPDNQGDRKIMDHLSR